MRKRWNYPTYDVEQVKSLQHSLGIDPLLCQLLVQNGIADYENTKLFFRPKLQHLYDPFLMKDMDQAVRRLGQAVERKETILLYGDYDVDGTCSVALMYTFLSNYHKKVDYYIPDRYKEGYGLSLDGIEYAKKIDAKLIIAMDCGIKAMKAVDLANSYKIDCIICDHHLPADELPNAIAVLDPKRDDCPYPYKELTGCGIAFKLAQAYQSRIQIDWQELEDLLDILVMSIACDIVPITGENRVMAHFGLKKLNERARLGIKALIRENNKSLPFSIRDVVFGMGPLINAAGRLDDARQAVRLLLAEDQQVASDTARQLVHWNNLRKQYERQSVEEACDAFINAPAYPNQKSVVLYSPSWEKGVVGITAARMVDTFYKPSIILTKSGEHLVGSARSVRNFDIHKALQSCSQYLENFGGHFYAAGLTIHPDQFAEFQAAFETYVATNIDEAQTYPILDIAAKLPLTSISPSFWRILKQFAPFGPKNRNPNFVSEKVIALSGTRVLKEKHLRLIIQQKGSPSFTGIGFDLGHFYDQICDGQPFSICYNIQENHWRGKTNLQLNVKDIKID